MNTKAEAGLDKAINDGLIMMRSKKIDAAQETTDGSGRQYITIHFDEDESFKDPHYIGNPKLFKKAFFEDTHSNVFEAAEKAGATEGGYLKIPMMRATIDCDPYYVVDPTTGEKRQDQDDNDVIGSTITCFVMKGENIKTEYRKQLKRLARDNRFVNVVATDEPEIEVGVVDKATAVAPKAPPVRTASR
jgi:hypothetical protein